MSPLLSYYQVLLINYSFNSITHKQVNADNKVGLIRPLHLPICSILWKYTAAVSHHQINKGEKMFKTCTIGGLAGGIILFIWSAVSWMVLPWHMMNFNSFKDETAVAQTITANAPQSGIYLMPIQPNAQTQGPAIFASVHLEGMANMTHALIIQFIIQLVSAFLVTWLLTKTSGLGYMGRLGFIIIFALTVGIIANFPYWNWFNFSTNYTLVQIADTLVGWFLAGLVLAKIAHEKS